MQQQVIPTNGQRTQTPVSYVLMDPSLDVLNGAGAEGDKLIVEESPTGISDAEYQEHIQRAMTSKSFLLFIVCSILFFVLWLALIIPSWAVTFRRLHDVGQPGWWLLGTFIPFPFIGLIFSVIILVFCCQDSKPGTNRYGRSEKYPNE